MTVSLGDRVQVHGTGDRWGGAHYPATVVDIRASDDSIKVKFPDGGFKRYPRGQFEGLLLPAAENALDSLFQDDCGETYYPSAELDADELTSLRTQIHDAVMEGDFNKAAKLKKNMEQYCADMSAIGSMKQELLAAIQKDDFERAAVLKEKITISTKTLGQEQSVSTNDVFNKALKRALGGGLAGAGAMVIQVCSLMWMRTTMNYQYRYGTTTKEALRILYAEGGVRRFYRGILPALAQGPLSRFGDTAANTGMLAFLDANDSTRNMPTMLKTMAASGGAATWRIFLMPLDTIKTTMQVEGKNGVAKVMGKVAKGGPTVLYHGALASAGATFVGHFPWFFTFNTLDKNIPVPDGTFQKLSRTAFMGFCSSFISDCSSNSIRVVKTYRQTSEVNVTYKEAIQTIVAKDGWGGLFGRGLKTRIAANGVQGVMFSVMWKFFEGKINGDKVKKETR